MRKPKSTTTRKKLGGSKNRSEPFILSTSIIMLYSFYLLVRTTFPKLLTHDLNWSSALIPSSEGVTDP